MTSSPGLVKDLKQTWLPIVPEGTKSAFCFPKRKATISSNFITVGSSPKTSSPTSASAMAFLISLEGRVTVSLLKSMNLLCSILLLLLRPHSREDGHITLPSMGGEREFARFLLIMIPVATGVATLQVLFIGLAKNLQFLNIPRPA